MDHPEYCIKAVLFDFDGTLTRPGAIDFKYVKSVLGCPSDQPMLEFIQAISDERDRQQAMEKLNQFEIEGAAGSVPNTGARRIVRWIQGNGLPVVILTRNSREAVMRSLENFGNICADDFNMIITRDDPPAPKPSGDGIVWAADQLGIPPHEVLMVGDFIFDLQAGRAAGAHTVLIDPSETHPLKSPMCDFRIKQLDQLRQIIRGGLTPLEKTDRRGYS